MHKLIISTDYVVSWLRVGSFHFGIRFLIIHLSNAYESQAFVYLIVIAACAHSNVEFKAWWWKMKKEEKKKTIEKQNEQNVLRLPDKILIHAAFNHLKCS